MRNKVKHLIRYGLYVALVCAVVPVFAADNSCENEDSMINPALALCSTHVYNIGAVENPSDGGDKEMMKDVVALKTTIMTQQMYKQYEYLESMIKRFKTQLEKAVLTTKLQSSGAGVSNNSVTSDNSAYQGSDRNVFIAGVSNCNNELTNLKVFECLNANLNSIYNASNNGQNMTTELRKQLANDYSVAANACDSCSKDIACTKYQQIGQRTQFQKCLDSLRAIIRTGYENASSRQNRQAGAQYPNMQM